MTQIQVNNAPRECGTMKKGGFYFGSSMSAGGTLRVAWFPFGDFSEVYIDCGEIAAVGQYVGHWPLSAVTHGARPYNTEAEVIRMYQQGTTRRPGYAELRSEFGTLALFDHVGEKYYTPHSFVEEMKVRGPNRRTSPQTAREVAQLAAREVNGIAYTLPFPILFTAKLPVFTRKQRTAVERLLQDWGGREWEGFTWEPTYLNGLSPSIDGYSGSDHFGTVLIHAMHQAKMGNEVTRNQAPLKALAAITSKCYHVEQPFAGSMVCNIHRFDGTLTDNDRRSGIVSSYAAS